MTQVTTLDEFTESQPEPFEQWVASEVFAPGALEPNRTDPKQQRLAAHDVPGSVGEIYQGVGAVSISYPISKPGFFQDIDEDTDLIARDLANQVRTDGGQQLEPEIIDPENPPANETVKLIKGISGVMHRPKIVEGETSSTGKTIEVTVRWDSTRDKTYRLDSEKLFSGGLEVRNASTFELYTPARYIRAKRANHAPGPQAGADNVPEYEEIPAATHYPPGDDLDDAPEQCPNCGQSHAPWRDQGAPECEACGERYEPETTHEQHRAPTTLR